MSINILPNTNTSISDEFYIQNSVQFNIKNISVPLANSIRRILLSNIPSVAFDDTWNDSEDKQAIDIIKNKSGLHNEFIAQRLSLIPIHVYENHTRDVLKISTRFNKTLQKREYYFNSEDIPMFHLHVDSEHKDFELKNRYGLFEVNTSHIEYSPEYSSKIMCSDYFQPDLFLKEAFKENNYIILNMLKSSEELSIYLRPTIGLGKDNARYCQVGTVSYMFETDESKFEQVFNQTVENENNERVQKKLNHLNENEVRIKKQSFMVLDKERVYKTNIYNEPNSFNFCVESIGVLPSHQLVYDSFTILKLKLYDVIHSFNHFEQYENNVIYDTKHVFNDKIEIKHSIDNLFGYTFILRDENHTLGNLINYYLNILYVKNYTTNTNINIDTIEVINSIPTIDSKGDDLNIFKIPILEQCGYKMPHPLKEDVQFKIKIRNDISDKVIDELYQKYSSELAQIYNISVIEHKKTFTIVDKQKTIIIYMFINSIMSILDIISNIKEQWVSQTSIFDQLIDTSSFIIGDSEEFFKLESSTRTELDTESVTKLVTEPDTEPPDELDAESVTKLVTEPNT